ncbi:hypothetical protein CLIB1423_03S01508 [[Candida] railenensis]|uniref:Homeobox domain-containing protein n=1 Tax=[Candida] railenensis TaxID=45579 RepID=A0A9P0QL96_9ASCO|nr:hypothetical protein CLIB1423_03S01508 [[Candida] railenensis]
MFVFSTWLVSAKSAGYTSYSPSRLRTSSARGRPAFSTHAREHLELSFRANPAPTKFQCMEIKEITKLSYEQVRTWFNNKRRRTKKDESGYFIHENHYIVSINQFSNT